MSNTPLKSASPLAFIAAAVLLAAVVGAAVYLLQTRAPTVISTQTGRGIGGPFQLVDEDGAARDETLLKGKWSAVFFGYTSCPDVCPMTLQALSQASEQLGGGAKDFQIVFISVDPARDTPAQVKAWLAAQRLPAASIGLTGSKAQVEAAAKAYGAYASVIGSGDASEVQHSSAVYLMNPKGEFSKPLVFNQPPDQLAAAIKAAMKDG
ncbi:MAG: SCO1/SenC family protein [Caulobacteraceae bacterium]|nr:SCO1/SenC family protein [Caulobacteraceae bacterium]